MKTKLFTLLLAIMACATLSAEVLFSETLETRRGSTYIDRVLQSESGFTYWPYASQWFTGYTAQNDKIVDGNQYDNDYTAVSSYTVSIRGKKLNGAPEASVGMYFATGKEEARNYVRFDGGLPEIPAKGAYSLFVEICSSETDGGDLSTMVVKVNDETLEVPATTLGNQYVTSTVEIALPAGKIESLYIAFNNLPTSQQKFISRITICRSEVYTLSIDVNDPKLGSVSGGGTFKDCPRDVIITATPADGCRFVQWSDGNTDNPRTINLTQDISLTAIFTLDTYTFSASCDERYGKVVAANGEYNYLSQLAIIAEANYGYHFVEWSDGNTENPRIITLTENTELIAIFAPNIYTISDNSNKERGYITGVGEYEYLASVRVEATPVKGYQFTKWSDESKDNPRTIEVTKDIELEALFDYQLTGMCGKGNALTWTFDPSAMALNITGNGSLSENYTYGTFIESLTIGNEVSVIGSDAFAYFPRLTDIIIGSSVKVLEERAFYNCPAIKTITCYSQRPPTVNSNALYGLDYSTIVYVPVDYLNNYQMHDAWGLYDVRPFGATTTTVANDEVNVEPTSNTADVTWPAVENAATYELTIKDKNGNVICTLVFNAQGQLTSIAFAAPSRMQTAAQATGFTFTVTGLDSGSQYGFTMDAKDSNGTVLDTKEGSFTTTGGIVTAVDNASVEPKLTKVLRNGQLFILRGDKTYTVQGQEVR